MKTYCLILLLLAAATRLFAAARSDLADRQRYSSSKYNYYDTPDSNVLFSDVGGGKLATGQRLTYRDYHLVMQSDCNLVAYNKDRPIWNTGTWGRGQNCYLILQSDGQLVLYGQVLPFKWWIATEIWRTNQKGTEGVYALVLNYDGSVHVYGPTLWSSPSGSTASLLRLQLPH
ncbi:mannose-specific lectin-like [Asparagus officinalis]|uniref:mannose-specific lectin-like n=1 Tax=Asparagus officinalis TaxID=4686 RepID=UPI00098E475D|nr:mannose-specific lectin-like [Asparagus officinalis]